MVWAEIATRYITHRSTRDGTAKGSEPGAAKKGDFEKSSGELVFTDGENFQSITVTVYDDVETEVDEARARRPVGRFFVEFELVRTAMRRAGLLRRPHQPRMHDQ